jgi:hypothetical protein
MAKDVLSIAMAGVGVERIFNSGRDIAKGTYMSKQLKKNHVGQTR